MKLLDVYSSCSPELYRSPIIILCKVGDGQTFPSLASFTSCNAGSANGNYRALINCCTLARCSTDDGCDQLWNFIQQQYVAPIIHTALHFHQRVGIKDCTIAEIGCC